MTASYTDVFRLRPKDGTSWWYILTYPDVSIKLNKSINFYDLKLSRSDDDRGVPLAKDWLINRPSISVTGRWRDDEQPGAGVGAYLKADLRVDALFNELRDNTHLWKLEWIRYTDIDSAAPTSGSGYNGYVTGFNANRSGGQGKDWVYTVEFIECRIKG